MDVEIYTKGTKQKTRKILFIGFDGGLYLSQIVKAIDTDDYDISYIDDSSQVFDWLTEKNNKEEEFLPHAIICDYDFLIENKYNLLNELKSDAALKALPFIVFSKNNTPINPSEALKRGIDDFYVTPVNWSEIRKRIEFLYRYKGELLEINGNKPPESYEYKIPAGKRAFDILFASVMLLILSPVLLLVALLVKLESKGPIVYRSKRVGSGYQIFDFLKFRSMFQGADAKLAQLSHLNQYDSKGDGPTFVKIQDDPRVTRVGKFIRKTSLDELPQLFNVLFGNMSIVGNRPLPLYEAEQLTKDDWAMRFLAPAGITGLWQVSKRGKSNMSVEERIQLDISYAENFSFWYDTKILAKTIPAMIQDEAV